MQVLLISCIANSLGNFSIGDKKGAAFIAAIKGWQPYANHNYKPRHIGATVVTCFACLICQI